MSNPTRRNGLGLVVLALATATSLAEETPAMRNLAATTVSGFVEADYLIHPPHAPVVYYASPPGPFQPGLGVPVLVLQPAATRPIRAHVLNLSWGRRITLQSALEGELRFTLDGSLPNINSRLYRRPISYALPRVLRVGVFQADRMVTEAWVLTRIDLLEIRPARPGSRPRGWSSQRPPAWLAEVFRTLRREAQTPVLSLPAPSGSGEVLIEVSREVLRGGGIILMPPLPPTTLTTPEEERRIIIPPVPPGI